MDKNSLFDDFDEEIDIVTNDTQKTEISFDENDGISASEDYSAVNVDDEAKEDSYISAVSDNSDETSENSEASDKTEPDDSDIVRFLAKRRAKMERNGDPVYTSERHYEKADEAEKAKAEKKKLTPAKIAIRVVICTVTALVMIVITLLAAIGIICRGPSDIVRDMFVTNMVQTGQMDFLAYIFLSDEEVDAIMKANDIKVPEGDTDTSLIQIGGNTESEDENSESKFDINALEIIDIQGKTYKGKIMIVNDPSRVTVGTAAAYGENCVGYTTLYMAEKSNSIAAINGGGYEDKAGNKTGGIPLGREESGVVIAGGELKYGSLDTTYEIIGLDKNGILHVDNMTPRAALEKGIRDAVNWGPILVKNGEPCVVQANGSNVGFHPRSAIGQRKDGAILLLVIDGRQSNSLGASYDDLIEIMVNYGAVNAANLDGGMSSYMVYENKIITEPYLLYEPRNVATSWLVSRVEGVK